MRWPWQHPDRAELNDVLRRLSEVELDTAHIFKQLEKLRGRLTGGVRKSEPEIVEDDPPGMPPGLDPASKRVWKRRLQRGG